jgi:hypothetical protein
MFAHMEQPVEMCRQTMGQGCMMGGGMMDMALMTGWDPKQQAEMMAMRSDQMKAYIRLGAMVATSTVVMLGLMYLNTYQLDRVFFSETRTYMALLMGASMGIVMLAFMRRMYTRTGLNIVIFIGSALIFALALWLVRSQTTVDDVSYMRAMIPTTREVSSRSV